MNKVADDVKPMTGIWYRSTTDAQVMAKVTRVSHGVAHVVMTGGVHADYPLGEFAESWVMV